jgi:hypothetical protein
MNTHLTLGLTGIEGLSIPQLFHSGFHNLPISKINTKGHVKNHDNVYFTKS